MRELTLDQLKVPGVLLSLCFAFSVFPMHATIMSWVWVLFLCAIGVVWAKLVKKIRPLKNVTLNLLAIFCMLLLLLFSGQFGLLSTMINLLVVAGCLKLITLRTTADFHLIIIVLIFLIACGFIYHQQLLLAVYYGAILFTTMYTAFLLNKGKLTHTDSAKQSAKLILQAIPIMLLLFIMVPRLPPLWESAAQKSSSTGLSETITPGDIANLAQSGELAFRAEFISEVPPPQQRYWRSIALESFDGFTWSIDDEAFMLERTSELGLEGEPTKYLIVAEPNNTRWQYSLDIPVVDKVVGNRPIFRNQSYQLFTQEVSKQPSLYIVSSYLSSPLNHFMNNYEREKNLQLPEEGNEQTRKWVNEQIFPDMPAQEKVRAIMQMFFQDKFSYTLQPPLMRTNPIDEFLFTHRRGFCSHYASSLAYMLRLAGVPARLVAGYQGGELQNDNILTVRQYDAHAWVEYWLDGRGWTRIDPTAIVAPNRLVDGLFSSITENESELIERPFNLSGFNNIPIVAQLRDWLVMIDHQWTQTVLRYDQDSQRDLIKKWFGEFSAKSMTTFMLAILATIVLFLALVFLPYKKWFERAPYSPASQLLIFLKKKGWEKRKHETLQDFIHRLNPRLNAKQQASITHYVEQCYAHSYGKDKVAKVDFQEKFEKIKLSFKQT
jgi:transglutaminase-like putative cysteine protease